MRVLWMNALGVIVVWRVMVMALGWGQTDVSKASRGDEDVFSLRVSWWGLWSIQAERVKCFLSNLWKTCFLCGGDP